MRAFLAIRRGLLVAEVGEGKKKVRYAYPADKSGAAKLAAFLAHHKIEDVSYSSSIDFPEDGGGPDLDFRSLIEATYMVILTRKLDKIRKSFLDSYLSRGSAGRWAIVRQVSNHLTASQMRECLEGSKTSIHKGQKID
jgi:hypothetical protein